MPSTITCLAAVATAIRPEAHWRSIVWPATVSGRPATMLALRAAGDADLLRLRAFHQQELGLAHVHLGHAVADEAVAHARHHRDFAR
jgi:hypothetical protein